jgi:glutathione S-transferase
MCYLVNKYGQGDPQKEILYPKEPEARAKVDRILFFDTGSLYKCIVDYFVSF